MLARVRAALPIGGRLVLRIGDAAARRGFAASSWVDRFVKLARGQRLRPPCRPDARRLAGTPAPSSASRSRASRCTRGTPFANVLLVATVERAADAEAEPHDARRRSTTPASRR